MARASRRSSPSTPTRALQQKARRPTWPTSPPRRRRRHRPPQDGPRQWQTWWWICFAGQVVFIPFVFSQGAVEPAQGAGRRGGPRAVGRRRAGKAPSPPAGGRRLTRVDGLGFTAAMSRWRSCRHARPGRDGEGGASIVRGDPGIGKSTLLAAVVERARERAMTVSRRAGCSLRRTCRSPVCTSCLRRSCRGSTSSAPPSGGACSRRSGWRTRKPPIPSGSRSRPSTAQRMRPRTRRC